MGPQIGKIKQIPAIQAIIKIKNSDRAGVHINMIIAIAEIKVQKTITARIHRQGGKAFQPL